ncbi:MAG: sterol desaturase family protein [Rhodobacterales bacterium]|nr:sterol desaturase family protein [Rhodobacterales bacterium]
MTMNDAENAIWAQVWEQLQVLFGILVTDLGSRLSPLNLMSMVGLCLILWIVWRPSAGFLAWLFPARVYRNPSFWLDVRLFLFNWTIGLFITLNYVVVATATAWAIGQALGAGEPMPDDRSPMLSALIVFLAADLTMYWYHRLHHDRTSLWAIHALHHSAEEMSPVTAFRHHPIYSVLGGLVFSVCVGAVQGLAVVLVLGSVDTATLAGTNLFSVILNLGTANLRHSHIRLCYPDWLEHVLISPAQHQVHHSVDPRHYNRNYGEVLAVWDWLFGTLYITQPGEEIRFGLGDASGQPITQRHPTFRTAMTEPVRRAWSVLRGRG